MQTIGINRQQHTDSWPLLNLNSISEILNSSYRTLDWPKQALNQKIEAVTATLSFKTNLFNKIVWNSNKNIQKTEKVHGLPGQLGQYKSKETV